MYSQGEGIILFIFTLKVSPIFFKKDILLKFLGLSQQLATEPAIEGKRSNVHVHSYYYYTKNRWTKLFIKLKNAKPSKSWSTCSILKILEGGCYL